MSVRIGVLAMQGDVIEHTRALGEAGAEPREIRLPADLDEVAGLVIPGGESTTIGKLMREYGLLDPTLARAAAGMPIFGTCAGMIVLAREISDGLPDQVHLGLMDIRVRRNAFGRQRESFETFVDAPAFGGAALPAVFIRAPVVESSGPDVAVLGRHEGRTVLVRQGGLLAAAFHPELTSDRRVHAHFVDLCRAAPGPA